MSPAFLNVLMTATPWALLVVGLMIVLWIDPFINRQNRRLILLIDGLVLLLMAAEITEYMIERGESNDLLRTCASAFGYAVRPVLLVLFLQVLFPSRRKWPFRVVAGANALVYFLSIFTGIAFSIQNNRFYRGPLNRLCLVVGVLLLLDSTVMLVRLSRQYKRKEIALILFSTALIVAGILVDGASKQLFVIDFSTMAIICSTIFYCFWLHSRFAQQHEAQMIENLQAEHRIQLMISQIQPHFLYNTLSTIQALCRTDPEKASELVERLGNYLRKNLDSLTETKLVPFEKEMEHTQTYTAIEQVRFPSIHITFDLEDTAFLVPALTVQPLVENAIRHGVRIRVNGEILVRSRREGDAHVVTIQDNGKGFDVDAALQLDSDHIGLRNVRERVEQMCSGTLNIESKLGEGTTVTLYFPERKETA